MCIQLSAVKSSDAVRLVVMMMPSWYSSTPRSTTTNELRFSVMHGYLYILDTELCPSNKIQTVAKSSWGDKEGVIFLSTRRSHPVLESNLFRSLDHFMGKEFEQ